MSNSATAASSQVVEILDWKVVGSPLIAGPDRVGSAWTGRPGSHQVTAE